jgi:UDP-glucose 4-epimerase
VIKTSKRILGKDITIVEKDAGNMSVRRVSADKAKEKINWQTEIGLEEGLKDLNKIL